MENKYKVLNCTENSSLEEITNNYKKLKEIYSKQRFEDGEVGNLAAKKLTELEQAYQEILEERKENKKTEEQNINKVREYISKGDFINAQYILDTFDDRDAEWHYLQSVIYYKKSWYNESKKQLEIAIGMDPAEPKYKEELENLNKYLNSGTNNSQFNQNYTQNTNQTYQEQPQMGGTGCMESCCQCLACNALLNCCCNCGRC